MVCNATTCKIIAKGGQITNSTNVFPTIGQQFNDMLSNIAPGLGTFVLIVGIFLGIGALVAAIAFFMKNRLERF